MKLPDWHWLIGVNLWGVIHGVTTFLPILKANADGGHIVNTAAMGGLAAMANLGGYAVTKDGVVALTETLVAKMRILLAPRLLGVAALVALLGIVAWLVEAA